MNRIIAFRSSCIFLLALYLSPVNLQAQTGKKKALFIIADGIPADVLEKLPTPNIDKVAAAGSYLRAYVGGETGTYNETPTISAVSYNSILTGTWVNKHNVWGNSIKEPNYNYWNIFRFYKESFPKGRTAVFSSWTDNRTKLIGEKLPEAGALVLDHVADGYELDTVRFPQDANRDFMHLIDEEVSLQAAKTIREKSPDLSWVYLEYTDDMGHMHGDGEAFYNAVKKLDVQVGRIWDAIQYRQKQFREDWLIIITTDHGRSENNGKDHGGQTPRQKSGWIVLNKPAINAHARYYQASITDIMPTIARHMNVKPAALRLRELDGLPLLGELSVGDLRVNYFQDQLDISWKALGAKEDLRVYITATNEFKKGGEDNYKLVGTVSSQIQGLLIPVKDLPGGFYKVVVEGRHNSVNRWFTSTGKNP